ncbi:MULTISPECIES: glycosyltransferase family 4 protein [Zwartia]|uniref:glycosyltransferase family 4 protein n=1 Tax=Zwartia TaxID=2978000 RepID=UPI0025B60781|nr:glycosyltransferase family 1 protein [Zwartia panacis]MDN4018028.1 glycosyltransferase family 1 protein [Zwartia panacis]
MRAINVAVDASRVRSGGGIAHLVGILDLERIDIYGIKFIHLWAYQKLLDSVPNKPWLIKHHPPETEMSIAHQLYWQSKKLSLEIKAQDCQVLFTAEASTVCQFKPMVVLSQNLLPFEKGTLRLFGLSMNRFRQEFIRLVQKRAFRYADGNIFLTRYAASCVQDVTGKLSETRVIPHGVSDVFRRDVVPRIWPKSSDHPIRCLYISPVFEYKHQWVVVSAIKRLRDQGHNLQLTLVGGGGQRAKKILEKQISISDPDNEFVEVLEFLPPDRIPDFFAQADLFIFASSCETFGITLLEAMASGLPIACSDRSSLPEVLQDGGVYFDPTEDTSIAEAVGTLISNSELRKNLSVKARALSEAYTWPICAKQTWQYIVEVYKKTVNGQVK